MGGQHEAQRGQNPKLNANAGPFHVPKLTCGSAHLHGLQTCPHAKQIQSQSHGTPWSHYSECEPKPGCIHSSNSPAEIERRKQPDIEQDSLKYTQIAYVEMEAGTRKSRIGHR